MITSLSETMSRINWWLRQTINRRTWWAVWRKLIEFIRSQWARAILGPRCLGRGMLHKFLKVRVERIRLGSLPVRRKLCLCNQEERPWEFKMRRHQLLHHLFKQEQEFRWCLLRPSKNVNKIQKAGWCLKSLMELDAFGMEIRFTPGMETNSSLQNGSLMNCQKTLLLMASSSQKEPTSRTS